MQHINNMTFTPKSNFLGKLSAATSKGLTENGAVTFTNSGSNTLDFYAQAGAMRKNPEQALELFKKAFAEDRQTAVRILFYLRDVRGGQGERTLFRTCLEFIGTDYPEVFEKIVELVPEYGRWDDLFFDNEKAFEVIKDQMSKDYVSENPSLLGKWLPTINASSKATRAKAQFFAKKLGADNIEYRKAVRTLRKKIKAVEEFMSARKWEDIEYSKVPSQASRIYKNASKKHDEERYGKFIEKAITGEVKINAATLYPYQIYKNVRQDYSNTLEALWNQLPDYTMGKNALVVADTSGSMMGDPMSVAVSLALYFAERNTGQFKNAFMTFSSKPKLQRVVGNTLKEKMSCIETGEIANTDLQAVFNIILETAVKSNTPKEELPSTIYIISDMEFDDACNNSTNFEVIQQKYQESGYKMPNIVFWNVKASGKNVPSRQNEQCVALVSGFSPVIFKMAVENKTPEQVMMDTINSERYSKIVL